MVPALPTHLATISLLSFFALVSSAANRDILRPGTSLAVEAYQSEILQSPDGTFSCGFYGVYDNAFTFSIWYSKATNKTVVWSANRHRPVHSRRSALTLHKDGNMVLTDYDDAVVWQTDDDGNSQRNVKHAQLLDTGNLIVKNTSGTIIWQSFDSPTDTLLPVQLITAATKLVSTTQSRAPGNYIFRFNDISVLSLIYDVPEVSDIYASCTTTEVRLQDRWASTGLERRQRRWPRASSSAWVVLAAKGSGGLSSLGSRETTNMLPWHPPQPALTSGRRRNPVADAAPAAA